MKTKTLLVLSAVLVAGSLSPAVKAMAQEAPKKGTDEKTGLPVPTRAESETRQTGVLGGKGAAEAGNLTAADVSAQIEAAIARMTALMAQSQGLAKSFGDLAQLHEGADRSEILMMQQMSESMATMAGVLRGSFQRYKQLLDEETASETGTMKAELANLKGMMDDMAHQVDGIVRTLQSLQEQMGQG